MTDAQVLEHLSRADRPTSFDIDEIPVPNGREEDWRFTPMRRVEKLFDLDGYEDEAEVVIQAPKGIISETVPMTDPRLGKVLAPGDRTAVVAWNAAKSATIVTVPKDMELEDPVVIAISAKEKLAANHILIMAEENANATVILGHSGHACLNQTVEIRAKDGAQLNVITIHEWERDALHASNHRVSVGRDATLNHMVVTLGGDLVRVCVDTEYTAPGGTLHLDGLYFVDAGEHFEHRIFVDHSTPNCYSRVTYKGALQGKDAHGVWIGDCLIGEQADATDTYELNRNLILTEGAKADSVPNLEIENGDIEGAGHASATGRFDDEQLFYLMSRGINASDAKRLVVRGFFAELINKIDVVELREHLMDQVEIKLEGSH
jgi:FeS assembly protein SufD